jgi:hypothetical protein
MCSEKFNRVHMLWSVPGTHRNPVPGIIWSNRNHCVNFLRLIYWADGTEEITGLPYRSRENWRPAFRRKHRDKPRYKPHLVKCHVRCEVSTEHPGFKPRNQPPSSVPELCLHCCHVTSTYSARAVTEVSTCTAYRQFFLYFPPKVLWHQNDVKSLTNRRFSISFTKREVIVPKLTARNKALLEKLIVA